VAAGWFEALAFAWLARQRWQALPGNPVRHWRVAAGVPANCSCRIWNQARLKTCRRGFTPHGAPYRLRNRGVKPLYSAEAGSEIRPPPAGQEQATFCAPGNRPIRKIRGSLCHCRPPADAVEARQSGRQENCHRKAATAMDR